MDANLVEDVETALEILRTARTIAVLGMRGEDHSHRPAFYVPAYLHRAGYEIFPIPVHPPTPASILGRPVYSHVADVPPPIDVVLVFRRPADIPSHVEDLVAAAPGTVWFQSGIRHPESAQRLATAGIRVVQNRCAMKDHARLR